MCSSAFFSLSFYFSKRKKDMSHCFVFSVALLGAPGVGKTRLARLVAEETTALDRALLSSEMYRPTRGVDMYAVSISVRAPTSVIDRVQLFDTPGDKIDEGITTGVVTGATMPQPVDGAIVMCSSGDDASIEVARHWLRVIEGQQGAACRKKRPLEFRVGLVGAGAYDVETKQDVADQLGVDIDTIVSVDVASVPSVLAIFASIIAPVHMRTEELRLAASVVAEVESDDPDSNRGVFPPAVEYAYAEVSKASGISYNFTVAVRAPGGTAKSTLCGQLAEGFYFDAYDEITTPEVATFVVGVRSAVVGAPCTCQITLWDLPVGHATPPRTNIVAVVLDAADGEARNCEFLSSLTRGDFREGGTTMPHHCVLVTDSSKKSKSGDPSVLHSPYRLMAAALNGSATTVDLRSVDSVRSVFAAFVCHVIDSNHRCVERFGASVVSLEGDEVTFLTPEGRRRIYEALEGEHGGMITWEVAAATYDRFDPLHEGHGAALVRSLMHKHKFADREYVPFDVFSTMMCRLATA
eukprot:PhM_4_TR528/c0_g5_i1/m.106184